MHRFTSASFLYSMSKLCKYCAHILDGSIEADEDDSSKVRIIIKLNENERFSLVTCE
jgi:hypothetical protein